MKKLIFIILSVITLSSCSSNNVKEVTKDTKIPNSVIESINDTTILRYYNLVDTEDNLYILSKRPTDKKWVIYKEIVKDDKWGAIFWFGFLICFCLAMIIIGIMNN